MTKTEFLKQMRDLIRMYEEEASNQLRYKEEQINKWIEAREEEASNQLRYKEEQINKWIEAREQDRKQKEQSSDPT